MTGQGLVGDLASWLGVFATVGGVKLNVEATGLDLPLGVTGRPPEVIRGDVNIDLDFTG
jgi:hypothetical protein